MKQEIEMILRLGGRGFRDSLFIGLAKLVFLIIRPFTIQTNIGRYLLADSVAKTGYAYFYCRRRSGDLGTISESFEYRTMKAFRPKKGDIVIDCGANVGKYAFLASKLVGNTGKVVAVEPEKGNIGVLRKNIRLNNSSNISVAPYAAWNKDKEITFYYHDSTGSSAKVKSKISYKVKARTIASIMREFGLKRIDWLKIDVEEAEMEVLEGTDLSCVKNIILEYKASKRAAIKKILKKAGFSVTDLTPTYLLATR
jgi:FkbM family methyltransferase